MGAPLQQQVALPVTHFDADLAALVADMDDTMRALSGAGIAAPQIGVSLRVVIFELRENPRHPHITPVPYSVLVNPAGAPAEVTSACLASVYRSRNRSAAPDSLERVG